MTWIILSVLTAICESTKDVLSKKIITESNRLVVAWAWEFFAFPFLILILFFIKVPNLGDCFFFALFFRGVFHVVSIVLYMTAIKSADLSLMVPMTAFTPVFLLMTSPYLVNEFPTVWGVVGIFLIVFGSYVLHLEEAKGNPVSFWAPFRLLLQKKESWYMLAVAIIWSVTSNLDKIGIQKSSSLFWPVAASAFEAVLLSICLIYVSVGKKQKIGQQILSTWKVLIPIGLFSALVAIFQMTAISLAQVAYVISIKRTSAIITVWSGHFFFNEKNLRQRLLGASIMILGVVVIVMFGL